MLLICRSLLSYNPETSECFVPMLVKMVKEGTTLEKYEGRLSGPFKKVNQIIFVTGFQTISHIPATKKPILKDVNKSELPKIDVIKPATETSEKVRDTPADSNENVRIPIQFPDFW